MSPAARCAFAAFAILLVLNPSLGHADDAAPLVEVVFCVDTTGSMTQFIEPAQKKIWEIHKELVARYPGGKVRIGLVAYRDRGEEYVTRVFDLSDDLDSVKQVLFQFEAKGGGDEPESVNKALYDAVTEIGWSNDNNAVKMIYLIGDAPPHMDYLDEAHYPVVCRWAVAKNICINTIQCGDDDATRKYWLDISRLGLGSYDEIKLPSPPPSTPAAPEKSVFPPPSPRSGESGQKGRSMQTWYPVVGPNPGTPSYVPGPVLPVPSFDPWDLEDPPPPPPFPEPLPFPGYPPLPPAPSRNEVGWWTGSPPPLPPPSF